MFINQRKYILHLLSCTGKPTGSSLQYLFPLELNCSSIVACPSGLIILAYQLDFQRAMAAVLSLEVLFVTPIRL
uniref:Uncharacterized protein n=1 Tax=Utricularia reniformis TaxID=192314 RepID=A0A1Y0B2Y2_9LAMI|nr:hypothetical protein AEK19_MT1560 [Utricularia reniformis]ART31747.1 hypothetical protein AEK19_MT1560 [Utricularia reniformis]